MLYKHILKILVLVPLMVQVHNYNLNTRYIVFCSGTSGKYYFHSHCNCYFLKLVAKKNYLSVASICVQLQVANYCVFNDTRYFYLEIIKTLMSMPTLSFPFKIVNRQYIFNFDQLDIFLDTGSPISIGKELTHFEFNGKKYSLSSTFAGHPLSEIEQDIGCSIDILMGMDILCDFKVFIDNVSSTISFLGKDDPLPLDCDCKKLCSLELKSRFGFPRFSLQGSQLKLPVDLMLSGSLSSETTLVVDTGAPIAYMLRKFIDKNEKSKGEVDDFSPFVGKFKTPQYTRQITLFPDVTLSVDFGILPSKLEGMVKSMADAVIGYDLINAFHIVCFNFFENKMIFIV
jgi:hypothetical protein